MALESSCSLPLPGCPMQHDRSILPLTFPFGLASFLSLALTKVLGEHIHTVTEECLLEPVDLKVNTKKLMSFYTGT